MRLQEWLLPATTYRAARNLTEFARNSSSFAVYRQRPGFRLSSGLSLAATPGSSPPIGYSLYVVLRSNDLHNRPLELSVGSVEYHPDAGGRLGLNYAEIRPARTECRS